MARSRWEATASATANTEGVSATAMGSEPGWDTPGMPCAYFMKARKNSRYQNSL